ncbi:MAG: hypothetical protein PWQ46_1429 [Methanomicrobiaceae archaeon]|nr:hypothetical protein [Methanomicrobiaceae archaeon]
MMIASGKPCHGGNRIFVESLIWHSGDSLPGSFVSMENRPRGGGADGEGGGGDGSSLSCLDVSLKNLSRWITPHLPAATAVSSRPLKGGGQCMAIVRIPCYGGKQDLR